MTHRVYIARGAPVTLLENHTRALRLGWSIETRPTATGILVHAERVMSGGKFGPATPNDQGITIAHDDLEAALGKLFRVILPKCEAVSDFDSAHRDGRILQMVKRE